jgi:hypothetical protein
MEDSGDHGGNSDGPDRDSDGQRGAQRFSLLIRTAKLVYPFGEFLCIVRDVSTTGLRLKVFHPLPEGKEAEIELANGERYPLEWVWEDDSHAGFRFPVEIDLHRFINEESHWSRRPIRLKLTLPAVLTADGAACVARVHDLSQHGARIECSQHLAEKQKVKLEAEGLPALIANVAWRSAPHYGLVLQQTFTFEALAKLAARLQANAMETEKLPGIRKGIA